MQISNFGDFAFIGLGSNLGSTIGSPRENILEAIRRLEKLSDDPLIISSLQETAPVDCPPGSPDFINAVVALLPQQDETAESLLQAMQRIESSMGRVRSGLHNEARIIDLDLLLFHEQQVNTDELIVPHQGMLDRKFVMEPLAEILEKVKVQKVKTFIKKNSAKKRS